MALVTKLLNDNPNPKRNAFAATMEAAAHQRLRDLAAANAQARRDQDFRDFQDGIERIARRQLMRPLGIVEQVNVPQIALRVPELRRPSEVVDLSREGSMSARPHPTFPEPMRPVKIARARDEVVPASSTATTRNDAPEVIVIDDTPAKKARKSV